MKMYDVTYFVKKSKDMHLMNQEKLQKLVVLKLNPK